MLRKVLFSFAIIQIFAGSTLTVDGWACGTLRKSCEVGTCCLGLICNQQNKCQVDCKNENEQCTEATKCCEGLYCEKGTCQLVAETCGNFNDICLEDRYGRFSASYPCCEGLGCRRGRCINPFDK